MTEVLERPTPAPEAEDGKVVIDREFLRTQAKEAVETFLSPLLGVYAAATGRRVATFRKRRARRRAA